MLNQILRAPHMLRHARSLTLPLKGLHHQPRPAFSTEEPQKDSSQTSSDPSSKALKNSIYELPNAQKYIRDNIKKFDWSS